MWDLATLNWINRQAAERARKARLQPFVPHGPRAVDLWPTFPFPNIGGFEPPGWIANDQTWFVDKTGWGSDSEPALTVEQFKDVLREYIDASPGDGYAITEEGPFQLIVTAFRRTNEVDEEGAERWD